MSCSCLSPNPEKQAGDRLFQVVDKAHLAERRQRLAAGGINVEQAEQKGQLELRAWENAYLRGNRFDQDAMLELIQAVLKEGRAKGFGMTRLWANMEWALNDLPGVHDIVEYETRLNKFLPNYDDVVVCTYDLNKFSAPSRHGHHAYASAGDCRRRPAREPILCTSRRISQ